MNEAFMTALHDLTENPKNFSVTKNPFYFRDCTYPIDTLSFSHAIFPAISIIIKGNTRVVIVDLVEAFI